MPHYENRYQVNDFSDLLEKMNTYPFSNSFYITHQHTPFDNYLKKYISENHKVIIQTRNIYKSLLSLKDMIVTKKMYNNKSRNLISNKCSNKELIETLIYNYVPFHCNFVKSWVENKIKGKKIFINYSDFVSNEKYHIKKILNTKSKNSRQSLIRVPTFDELDKKK